MSFAGAETRGRGIASATITLSGIGRQLLTLSCRLVSVICAAAGGVWRVGAAHGRLRMGYGISLSRYLSISGLTVCLSLHSPFCNLI